MASALRFAARKICSRVLQRPPQPYFSASASAAVKEEQRRIGHGGSSVGRFFSSGSPNNTKQGAQSAAAKGAESPSFTSNAEYIPWWSTYHPKFGRNMFLYTVAMSTGSVAILYMVARLTGGPLIREALGLEPYPVNKDDRQSD